MEDSHKESRYPTRNTKFAAALLVCGLTLKPTDPFTVLKDESGEVLTFWFTPSNNGMLASTLAACWDAPGNAYYIDWMREALEKRDWLIKRVVPGFEKVLPAIPSGAFKTDNIKLASVFCGLGIYLHGYRDKQFYFSQSTNPCPLTATEAARQFFMEDSQLADLKLLNAPISWMKKSILQYGALVSMVQGALRKATQVQATNKRGDTAFFSINASRDWQRKVLHELIAMGDRTTL